MLEKSELFFRKIAHVAVILYMLDIILLGSRSLSLGLIGGVSTRILFFGIAVITSIPGLLLGFREYIKNKYLLSVAFFMLLLVGALVLGIVNGNNQGLMVQDFKGFLNILIVFPMVYVLDDKDKMRSFIKIMIITLLGVALLVFLFAFYKLAPDGIAKAIYDFMEDNKVASLTILKDGVLRIFFHTASRLFAVAFIFVLAMITSDSQKKWNREFILAIFMCVSFLSYTRSIYLAIFVCFVAFVLIICFKFKQHVKTYMLSITKTVILTGAMILLLSLLLGNNLISVSINRCLLSVQDSEGEILDDEEDEEQELTNQKLEESNLNMREQRKQLALKNFKSSPIWGHGLGVENDVKGRPIEYFHLDMLSKMGIIGFIAFLFPFLIALYDLLVRKNTFLLLAGVISVLYIVVISYFNPCMNTSTGLMAYGMMMAIGSMKECEGE